MVKFLVVFGTSSLSAYFFHEMLLYYPVLGLFSFAKFWRGATGPLEFAGLLMLLEAMTYGCVRGWTEQVDPRLRAWLSARWAAFAPASG